MMLNQEIKGFLSTSESLLAPLFSFRYLRQSGPEALRKQRGNSCGVICPLLNCRGTHEKGARYLISTRILRWAQIFGSGGMYCFLLCFHIFFFSRIFRATESCTVLAWEHMRANISVSVVAQEQ